MKCNLLTTIIIACAIYLIILCMFPSEEFFVSNGSQSQGDAHLIGLVYPPRAGPLHTNIEFPKNPNECAHPFTAIYDQDPYLQYNGPPQY